MPELPEVEYAAARIRSRVVGATILRARTLHPSAARALPLAARRSLVGDSIEQLDRRGKFQLFRLASGRTLVAHFRLNGDWGLAPKEAPMPRYARAVLELSGGLRLALIDSRALASLTLHAPGEDPTRSLGPDATDRAFTGGALHRACAGSRRSIKSVLLDQRVVAGVGNIYAVEALWYAQVRPGRRANSLSAQECAAVVRGVRMALRRGTKMAARYYNASGTTSARFNVYDRAGQRCQRCGGTIARQVLQGRGTYYCSECQR